MLKKRRKKGNPRSTEQLLGYRETFSLLFDGTVIHIRSLVQLEVHPRFSRNEEKRETLKCWFRSSLVPSRSEEKCVQIVSKRELTAR